MEFDKTSSSIRDKSCKTEPKHNLFSAAVFAAVAEADAKNSELWHYLFNSVNLISTDPP